VDALIGAGLNHADAAAYAEFAFSDSAMIGGEATDAVNEQQWERLSLLTIT
jgi:hypothetical protein